MPNEPKAGQIIFSLPLCNSSSSCIMQGNKSFMKRFILIFGMVIFCAITNAQQDTARTDATINNATVYFGYGAELRCGLAVAAVQCVLPHRATNC
jgi:hypothetical protein